MTGLPTSNEKLIEEFEWAVRRHNDLGGGPHVLEVQKTRKALLNRMTPVDASRNDARDAARYRWLRSHFTPGPSYRLEWYLPRGCPLNAEGLDENLDAHLPVAEPGAPPLYDTRVLVWYRGGRGWWISKRVSLNGKDAWASAGSYCDINKVIAWRPLPAPPGES